MGNALLRRGNEPVENLLYSRLRQLVPASRRRRSAALADTGTSPAQARRDHWLHARASGARLPAAVEATAYFVVAEALTNVAKHARAGRAMVTARVEDGTLRVQVRDDGVGGARPDGSGLLGLADRLAVLDGQLRIESPADRGTLVAADFLVPG